MNKLFLLAPLMALLPGMALAQPQSGYPDGNVQVLEYVETPTRTRRANEETLAATTLINRDDIERLQARSVGELLQRAPGVSVSANGGPANLSSVFVRGTEPDHVLILIDGVRFASATAGIAAIQDIPVEQIDRIEIVRGPRSSLYGADALGGVIQIFTRRGEGAFTPHFSLGGGRYDSYRGQAGFGAATGNTNYSVNLARIQSNGYDICDEGALAAGCFTNEPDDDGYDRDSLSASIGHSFGPRLRAQANALYTDGNTEFDGSFTNASDTVQQVYGVSLESRPGDKLLLELTTGHSRDESEDFSDGEFVSRFETEQSTAGLQATLALNATQQLVTGVDYRIEDVSSTTEYSEDSRDNGGLYAQYLAQFGPQQFQLSIRGDDDEQFGDHVTGSATWGLRFAERFTLTAAFGTAFNSPSFNDLYFPGFSNPDLDPEESESVEIGLLYRQRRLSWSLRAFDTRVDELIALDSSFTPQNISEARLQGFEAESEISIKQWSLAAQASWLDAENRAENANRDNQLPRRPRYNLQFDADRLFVRHSLGATLRVTGSSHDDLANSRKLDGYVLLDLRSSLDLNPDWQLHARLSNLLGEDYETASFFNPPGRNLFLTFSYQPQPES